MCQTARAHDWVTVPVLKRRNWSRLVKTVMVPVARTLPPQTRQVVPVWKTNLGMREVCLQNENKNRRQWNSGSENENIELLNPIPLQFYENHRRDHVCENCVMRPSSLIRAAFNLRVTPRHIMQIYSLPNNPWAPPSLVKVPNNYTNQKNIRYA